MTPQKIWKFPSDPDPAHLKQLSQEFQMPPLVLSILMRRGFSVPETLQSFLNPQLTDLRDPYLMRDMDRAVDLFKSFILSGKRIVVLGDYDVDGVTATAMLICFLQSCGCQNYDFFIPNRFEHGYGLTQASVEALLTMQPELVMTVDNGITAREEVQTLQQQGIQTLITDHHLGEPNTIPEGVVINPNHPECDYPFKGISGCGVALKLLMATRKALREAGFWNARRPEPNLKTYLDFAAMGTVADVVPLVDENRLLVHYGLQVMNKTPRLAIQVMAQLKNVTEITSQTLGYRFGPLLNAAGRMHNASVGVELLICQEGFKAQEIAQELEKANLQRRETETEMLEIALAQASQWANRTSLVVHSEQFHEGIIGIIAARLVDRFYKPTLVFTEKEDHFKGSARSIPEVHIKQMLEVCADSLERFGGHAGAAGCLVHRSHFPQFVEQFEAACQATLTVPPQPEVTLEGQLEANQITWELMDQLKRLEPFGAHNPAPLFEIPVPQQMFQVMRDRHIKWYWNDMDIVGWNLAEAFLKHAPHRLAVRLDVNEFRGNRKIQLIVEEYLI